jgi:uncharacterized membrane protein
VLSKPIKLVLGEANYFPGLGLITGFVLLFVIGLAVNAFLVRRVLGFGEELLLRVPVVKTVYSAIRDMTRLVNTEKKKGDLDRVVTLDFGFGKLIGFVTQEHANTLGIGGGDDLVAVYLPMSYRSAATPSTSRAAGWWRRSCRWNRPCASCSRVACAGSERGPGQPPAS